MKELFRDLRKKDGSIRDFPKCNRSIIFLSEKYIVNLI